jgi:hypothetical protein
MRVACFARLRRVLNKLRARHGEHSVLIETEADFTNDPSRRCALYRRALRVADKEVSPTFSIRISFAERLLRDGTPRAQIVEQLNACKDEVARLGDDYDKKQWKVLMGETLRHRGTRKSGR